MGTMSYSDLEFDLHKAISIASYEEPVNRAAVVEVESLEPGHLSLRDSSAAKASLRDDGFR